MASRAREIREALVVEVRLSGGGSVRARVPTLTDLTLAGGTPLMADVSGKAGQGRGRIAAFERRMREVEKDQDAAQEFFARLLERCMVEPAFRAEGDGDEETLSRDELPPAVIAEIGLELVERAFAPGVAAAAAAEGRRFREDGGGASGEPGGAAVRAESPGDPAPSG